MSLRSKLSNRTAFILLPRLVCITGHLPPFQQYTRDMYYKKLLGRANTACILLPGKDELTSQKYRRAEDKYRQMMTNDIRLYNADTYSLFVGRYLNFELPQLILRAIVHNGTYTIQSG